MAIIAAAVLFVEVHFGAYDHGTHLLVLLPLVFVSGLVAGPALAASALAVGAIGAGAASLFGLGPAHPPAEMVAQLVLYGVAGSVFVALLSVTTAKQRAAGVSQPAVNGSSPPLVEPLTARELEILRLAAGGRTIQQISGLLFLSPNTVKTHLSHAYQKLGAQNRADAVRAALHCGCLAPDDICPHRLAVRAHNASNG